MNKLSAWQIILIAFFILITIVAVLIFGGVLPGFNSSPKQERPSGSASEILFWGYFPESVLSESLDLFKNQYGITVKYLQIPKTNYINQITEALASGSGPDLWILPENELIRNAPKTYTPNIAIYPERSFNDQFLDEAARLLIWGEQYAGFPLTVDPLILYWNRAIFRSENLVLPPKTWSEFLSISGKLTKIDPSGNILQSGAALGDFSNVRHAKDIFSFLVLQAGNPIVELSKINDSGKTRIKFASALAKSGTSALPAAESAARFFSDFSDPRKTSYSWSRILADSQEMFTEGRLAIYLGFGSEYAEIRNKNPHLDFDITEVPQISALPASGGSIVPASSFGHMNILVISKQSSQERKSAAINLMNYLSLNETAQRTLAKKLNHAPVLRALLAPPEADPVASVIYNSAIKSRGWLDPNPEETKLMFAEIVNSSLSKREPLRDAIDKAGRRLEALLEQINAK